MEDGRRTHSLSAKRQQAETGRESKSTEYVYVTDSSLDTGCVDAPLLYHGTKVGKKKTRAHDMDSCKRRKEEESNQEHEKEVESTGSSRCLCFLLVSLSSNFSFSGLSGAIAAICVSSLNVVLTETSSVSLAILALVFLEREINKEPQVQRSTTKSFPSQRSPRSFKHVKETVQQTGHVQESCAMCLRDMHYSTLFFFLILNVPSSITLIVEILHSRNSPSDCLALPSRSPTGGAEGLLAGPRQTYRCDEAWTSCAKQ